MACGPTFDIFSSLSLQMWIPDDVVRITVTRLAAEGTRPTRPQNQHRSLPFLCFCFLPILNNNKKKKGAEFISVLRGAETSSGKSYLSMLRRCHRTNLILPSPAQRRFWCIGPSLKIKFFPRRSTGVWIFDFFSFVNFDLTLMWQAPQCSCDVTHLKTNGKSGRETHFALILYNAFLAPDSRSPACDRITAGRKDQKNEDIEGVAVEGCQLSRRSGRYALRSLARTLLFVCRRLGIVLVSVNGRFYFMFSYSLFWLYNILSFAGGVDVGHNR